MPCGAGDSSHHPQYTQMVQEAHADMPGVHHFERWASEPGLCVFWKKLSLGGGGVVKKEPPSSLKTEGESVPHTYQIKKKANSVTLTDSTDRKQLLKEKWAM